MTLARQINLIISALFVVVFAGTFALDLANARTYLVRQLESHAQDTATSLGLSLSPHAASGDTLLMESMVDAIFDRGYYTRIEVETLNGKVIIDRHIPVRVEGVPGWFVRALPLPTPEASAKLMAGWRQSGEVRVVSHPGFAYRQLWLDAVDSGSWCLGALVLAIVVTTLVLRVVLRPLGAVERQALAISEREFPVVEQIPRTRELKRVVLAMNRMTGKVEQMLEEQQERVEELRRAAYEDALTGLGNAPALRRDLDRMVSQRERHAFGALAYVRMLGLDALNHEAGNEAGDLLLRAAADVLREAAAASGGGAAHLSASLFALILPDITRSDVQSLMESLVHDLSGLSAAGQPPAGVAIGLAYYGGGQAVDVLVRRVEDALANAERSGRDRWHMYDATETAGGRDVQHEERWRRILEKIVEDRAVVLLFQPVARAADGSVLHHEVLARIQPAGGDLVPASVFFPMAARVEMTTPLDRVIVETAIERLAAEPDPQVRYAVNLSRASVRDAAFVTWLGNTLEARGSLAARLSFEVTEDVAIGAPEALEALVRRLRRAGVGFGFDHCGSRDLALDYLRRLKADYVKIDGAFVTGIETDAEKQRYVRSLVDLCHLLDIVTIAEFVESEARLEMVRSLGLDCVQGTHVGAAVRR